MRDFRDQYRPRGSHAFDLRQFPRRFTLRVFLRAKRGIFRPR
jgi:hypothetical protein